MQTQPGLNARDVLLSVTTFSFDIFGLELFLPLVVGARVVLVGRDEAADGERLLARLRTSHATVMQATPATWRLLIEGGWSGDGLSKVLCGGEALPRELAAQLLERAPEVWNLYGPTETTIWSATARLAPEDAVVSIGRPIANTRIHILDRHLHRLPVGTAGELYIGGDGLARGYLGLPDLTAERFVADPLATRPGARLYRTGDLARWLPDGRLECLGRVDQQVKVRGFRIELGEIEAALGAHPAIKVAVVTVKEAGSGEKQLVAYLAHGSGAEPTVTELRNVLKARLPPHMVPSSFVFLDELPLTPNGKVDRKALAHLDRTRATGTEAYVAPRTPMEAFVADLWKDALGIERVSVRDNFFDLGGHSLLAMKVIAKVEKKIGERLNPREMIYQTLEQFAATCEQRPPTGAAPPQGLGSKLLGALASLRRADRAGRDEN
jgi:acyl-coenzyme A synthetase/AMP-(fatty) acid ligase